ncbi:hypothetical protein [Nesterenkonia flava]|uniref:Uncharacterized protein n=1 Tax=Nesterenkonia flava TaxID=469799 RepID=A0ABU1FR24_9MICC|nr:hypothetical protein [Nesterenkonia flava]MDR5711103.1 hypothetical protein [Nesterenkonia flava]
MPADGRGEIIAHLSVYEDGSTRCDQPCVQRGVHVYGDYIKPLLLLGELEPSGLLPLDPR